MDIKGHVVKRRVDRARVRHRRGVLRVVHARPRREAAPRHAVGAGRRRHRSRSPRRTPTRSRASMSTPSRGSSDAQCRAWVEAAKLNPAGHRRRGRDPHEALQRVRRRRLRPRRDQPAHPHARGQGACARREGRARRQRRVPPCRVGRAHRPRDSSTRARREAAEKGLNTSASTATSASSRNGAGLAMATLRHRQSRSAAAAANFLDIGGGADAEVMANAIEVINNDPTVKSIFINIFGGITKGEEVANGIVQALERVEIDSRRSSSASTARTPKQGRAIIEAARVRPSHLQPTMVDAARKAVELAEVTELGVMAFLSTPTPRSSCQGLTGSQGRFYGLRNRAYGTQVVGRRQPEEGRHRRRGHPRLRHRRRRCRGRRARPRRGHRPRAGRARRGDRSRRSRHRVHRRRHRGHPDARRGVLLQRSQAATSRTRAARAELPGHRSPSGECNIGFIPAEVARPGGPVGIVQPFGHAHVPGAATS